MKHLCNSCGTDFSRDHMSGLWQWRSYWGFCRKLLLRIASSAMTDYKYKHQWQESGVVHMSNPNMVSLGLGEINFAVWKVDDSYGDCVQHAEQLFIGRRKREPVWRCQKTCFPSNSENEMLSCRLWKNFTPAQPAGSVPSYGDRLLCPVLV